jgi:translation initiation factor 5B
MAPKKGSKKKGNDDWEAELGESIAPASPSADAATNGDQEEEESQGGGGLMNLLKKRKEKRKNKGLDNDAVKGEDPTAVDDDAAAQYQAPDLSTKAPQEADLDDEFALPDKKGKGGKGKQAQAKSPSAAAPNDDEETGEGGRVLTKAEKEKLKKEREKQRKKEQVSDRARNPDYLVEPKR